MKFKTGDVVRYINNSAYSNYLYTLIISVGEELYMIRDVTIFNGIEMTDIESRYLERDNRLYTESMRDE